ncbi:MAG: RHH-type transcriptional regulator, proline utilization regulon repressor / proline dehydrogenase, partial [Microbacteriaceae bacterium]|nr:RHH-type transcriptional regulator, proline utilization regulon repressor / proline dehydrogenase [Microbacteriaceae bacterium]
MLPSAADSPASNESLAEESIATVRRWLSESVSATPDRSAERLAGMLKDARGLDFTIGFVDRVIRPEDLRVAGRNLEVLSRSVPEFLPWYLRVAIQLGGGFAPLLPWPIVPIVRRVLRGMVDHLILDASPDRLDRSLSGLRTPGIRLNLNLLGEAVLGDEEADARLSGTRTLLERDDVDHVSIKVSSISSQLSLWSFEETVARVVNRLSPLYEFAAASVTRKFITLDMEEFHDLDLTVEVFRRLLGDPKFKNLEAGIVLQAYLPDALVALQNLTEWATERRLAGGAGVKVRVVKGANLAMERVDAELHGWPLATWGSKRETDANFKRMLDWSLTPERTDAVRIGVAGHNLFDIAHAWLLARQRRVDSRVEFEMLLGMTTGQADAVRRDVGGLLLYTPVVQPGEFDFAISYLIRRLEESSSGENFMSGVFELGSNAAVFDREAARFLASIEAQDDPVPRTHRVQDRSAVAALQSIDTAPRPFVNDPETDPSIAVNREWGRQILERVASSQLGVDVASAAQVHDSETLAAIVSSAAIAGSAWGERRADTRAAVLHSVAESIAAARARLIEVMASETGKTIAEADVEVSEAIDFANYYAEQARELDRVPGAEFVPSRLTVVTPPWNFPVSIPAGSALAALAAGSAVIIKPAPQARRCAAVLVDALWAGGIP